MSQWILNNFSSIYCILSSTTLQCRSLPLTNCFGLLTSRVKISVLCRTYRNFCILQKSSFSMLHLISWNSWVRPIRSLKNFLFNQLKVKIIFNVYGTNSLKVSVKGIELSYLTCRLTVWITNNWIICDRNIIFCDKF